MIFDSEEQKKQVTVLVLESPLTMTVGEHLAGPTEKVVDLVRAIEEASVISPEDVVRDILRNAGEKEG